MKLAFIKLFTLIIISLHFSCSKESLCEKFLCTQNNNSVKDFSNPLYRNGVWHEVSYFKERSAVALNFEFKNDSFLTIYGDDTSKKNWGKYIIVVNKNNNTGYIELLETAQFLNYTRNIRYDWLYNIDENYVYLDWRKDNRQLFSEISFVRIVKIK